MELSYSKESTKVSIQESLKLVPKGDVAFIEWDLVGEKVNKLSTPVMARFREIINELKSSKYKAAVLISRKSKIFIAGADIDEIRKLTTEDGFRKALDPAHEIFNAWEDLPIPTIAAVHGACLGGGCELILACDYRIATDAAETKIGLPEVKLGIIPGFGGCVRLPRVVGLKNALDIILAGKTVDARKAFKIGLVDEAVPQQLLEQRVKALTDEIAAGKKGKRRKHFLATSAAEKLQDSFVMRPVVLSMARKVVMKESKGFYPAPLKALEVVGKTYGMSNREKAIEIEKRGFCEVAITDVSKNLIGLFYMMEGIKKQTGVANKDIKPRAVHHMSVLGAGTMGGGIAQLAAHNDIEVRLKDINNDSLALGFKAAADIWSKAVQRRKMSEFDLKAKIAKISGTTEYTGFGSMDLVVEAIVEDMAIKKKVIAEAAKFLPAQCIVATNTSSLSVTEMAEAHPHPENFAGMHFFNPVHKMPLVEVIRGPKTSDETVATIFELSKRMGKTPVVVKDGPGFLVNRLLMPYMIEAMFLLSEGMNILTVDHYYKNKFGMPMGPFRLMDEVGLDVCMKVVKIFKKALGERIEVPALVETISGSKRLGKKSMKGFYLYDDRGQELNVDQSVYREMGLSSPSNKLSEKECLERGIFAMINEAARALVEDRIVETAQDVDLAMIMGTGFPPFRGGLLKYADSLGSKYIVQELELYASRCGKRFVPSQPLAQMAKADRKFYTT